MNRRVLLPLLLFAWLLQPTAAPACNVPVFRFALERWRTDRSEDRYEIFVFHRGKLSDEEHAQVEKLRALSGDPQMPANCDLATVDLSANIDPDLRKLWETQQNAMLPWVVVRFPNSDETRSPAWSGPLNSTLLTNLATSPARREIARRIMSGDSVVWLLLESGNRKRDEAVAEILHKELRRLEESIKLPEQNDDSFKLLSELPLRLRFSILRVARDNPEEPMLMAMLLRANTDLTKTNEPTVFPIFGRGRVLDGLVGKQINATKIEEEAIFLCGACSCIVKRLNPGVDLLIAADWDAVLKDRTKIEPEPPSGNGERVLIPIPLAISHDEPPPSPIIFGVPRNVLIGGIALAALLVLVTGTLALRSRMNDAPVE